MKRELQSLSAQLDGILTEFKKLDLGTKPGEGGLYACAADDAPKVYYPSIYLRDSDEDYELPETGKATVEYKVTRKTVETRNGKTKHSATLDILSIDPEVEEKVKAKKGEVAKMLGIGADRSVRAPVHHFAYGERARGGNGQFIADETGGADPTSMRQAYGGAPPAPQVVVNNVPPSRLKPAMLGGLVGAGAMTKRGKRLVRGAGQMAVRGARAVTGV